MQQLPQRIVRIIFVGAGAYAGYQLLEPYDLGWLVLPISAAVILSLALYRWTKNRRIARELEREESWSRAVVEGARRPGAIAEVRAAVLSADSVTTRVRLTVLLSDLVDADGEREAAEELLRELDFKTLPPIEGAVVRHALATLRFRAGDAAAARAVLVPRVPRCGDAELDLRLELLDATADIELGEADRALETATRIRRAAGADPVLVLEARIVRAAALDARGEHDAAVAALVALGPDVIDALTTLGGPRIRALAKKAAGPES